MHRRLRPHVRKLLYLQQTYRRYFNHGQEDPGHSSQQNQEHAASRGRCRKAEAQEKPA